MLVAESSILEIDINPMFLARCEPGRAEGRRGGVIVDARIRVGV